MKNILLLILLLHLVSCAHHAPDKGEDLVSLKTALMQAQASYLKGCVDAMKELKVPMAFNGCRDKSILHLQELEQFMQQDL